MQKVKFNNFLKLNYLKIYRVIRCLFFVSLIFHLCSFDFFKPKIKESKMTALSVKGELVEGNVLIELDYEFEVGTDKKKFGVFNGDCALVDHDLGERGKLEIHEDEICVSFLKSGKQRFRVKLAVLKEQKNAEFISSFRIPDFQIRPVKFNSGKENLNLKLHSLLKTERQQNDSGEWLYSGFMKLGEEFKITWQPKVEKLEKELSMICVKHSVLSVGVGSLKVDSLYEYQIVQGAASQLLLKVPDDLNVNRVHSKTSIRNWQIIKKAGERLLEINLRNKEKSKINLKIEAEQALTSLPAETSVRFMTPQDVLRVSGFVALGTDSALKLMVNNSKGLSQVEPQSFSKSIKNHFTAFPQDSLFVFNFAALPLQLGLTVDKIEPVIFTDSQFHYEAQESSLQLRAQVEAEVRDSAVRELNFTFDQRFNLANISVNDLKDYEVFEEEGQKRLAVYFKKAVLGKRLINITMEWSHKGWEKSEDLPKLSLPSAKTSRGFIAIKGSDGLLVDLSTQDGLRQIPVASLPTRSTNIQSAWRFKTAEWDANLQVTKKKSSLYSELFHLYSLGENVIYGSVSITTHISGAPIDELRIKMPENYKNIELISRHRPRLYKAEEDEWKVKLQKKINGDFTLLLTFEVNQSTLASEFEVGGIELPGSDSESGFITVSGPTGIKSNTSSLGEGLLEIEADQIPAAYKLLHGHPVHLAYKYVKAPHVAKVSLKSYDSVDLLSLVIEHSKMVTKVNANGERVTEVECWVKNSSHQNLTLTLPEGSDFWSCTVDGKQVRCTSKGDILQVPVPRNSDPNRTIHVKYTYAESGEKLKGGQQFAMKSPKYFVPAVFNDWQVQLPGGFSIAKQTGSMDVTGEHTLNSRLDIIEVMKGFVGWTFNSAKQQLIIFIFGLIILAICWHVRQVRVFGTVLGIILIASSALQLVSSNPKPLQHKSEPSYQVMNFKKTVSAANEVQKVSGVIVDNSVQVEGDSKPGLIYFILAILSLCGLVKLRNFIPPFAALIFTWLACSGNTTAEYYFAISLCLFLPVSLVLFLNRSIGGFLGNVSIQKAAAVSALLCLSFLTPEVRADEDLKPVVSKVISAEYVIKADDKIANIEAVFEIDGEVGESFLVLKSPCALLKTEYDRKHLKLKIDEGKCYFELIKSSKQKVTLLFEVPIKKIRDDICLQFYIPPAMRNTAKLTVKALVKQEISSAGTVFFSKAKNVNFATALFRQSYPVNFKWRAAEQKVADIPAVYFADTKTLCLAGEGSFDFEHSIDLKISRGEIRNLVLKVPDNQTVTSVVAPELSNWAFDPKQKTVEMVFTNGLVNQARLKVTTQAQNPSLLKDVKVSPLEVNGSTRQYGLVAVGAREGLKVQIVARSAVQEFDSVDFPVRDFLLNKYRASESALYSFNYMKLPTSLSVKALKLKAEVEVNEKANFSIGDDRLIFSSRLAIEIKKAGLFEIVLNLPNEYEIESLSVPGISHWDEINKENKRQIILYFKNRIKGRVPGNIVLVKNTDSQVSEVNVPKISLVGEKRHRGDLIISAEHGNRLEILGKQSIGRVVMVNDGSMSMSILRKDWSLKLSREVLTPRIEVESLEAFDFADNRYKVKGRAVVKVENAGTKFLTLQSKQKIQNLEVRGQDIARVEKLSEGIWRVEFKRKVFGQYKLKYQYQSYYDSSQQETFTGVQFTDAERQRGYMCMTLPSYMTAELVESQGLQVFEPRLLPGTFAGPEEKRSTLCYRLLQSNWSSKFSFTQHSKAELLQANVQNVNIETMVALDGRQLNVVNILISSGSKNFLKMKLPENSHLCSVFSNGKAIKASSVNEQLLIPLNQSLPGESSRKLQIIYITDTQAFDWQKAAFEGPQFDLPLKDVNWYLYVPGEKKYDDFKGSMKFIPEAYFFTNSLDTYLKENKSEQKISREQANVLLEQAYKWSNSGRRDLARKNYEAVVSLSESMSDINEDARIQLQSTLRQQTLVGLVNRRESLKANSSGEAFDFDERNYNGGHFSDSFAKSIEKTLEEDESRILRQVSDKIMSQQAAASHQVIPLKLALPKEGRQLRFYRQVQIEPMVPMKLSFKTKELSSKVPGTNKGLKQNISLMSLLLIGSFLMMGVGFKKKKAA